MIKTYDVWVYGTKGSAHRVARKPRICDAQTAAKPFITDTGYVYIMAWENDKSHYLCGWLETQLHTNDLRSNVRAILRG